MSFRLARDEGLKDGALRLFRAEVATGAARLRGEGELDARVHGARKAIKRARAVLRLVRVALGPQFAPGNVALRDAARRLAHHRDASVAAATFERLVPEVPPALVPLRDALGAARDASRREVDAEVAAAAQVLELTGEGAAAWPEFPRAWTVVAAGLRDSYRGGRRAMRAALADPSPAAFHEWRKRVKDLWYHTSILEGVWKPIQRAWAEALEQPAEVLGEEHDLDVLRRTLDAAPELGGEARSALLTRADARGAALRSEAFDRGRRLYAESTRQYVERMRCYWEAWRGDEDRAP